MRCFPSFELHQDAHVLQPWHDMAFEGQDDSERWGQISIHFGWSADLHVSCTAGEFSLACARATLVWLNHKHTADSVWILIAIIMFAEVFLWTRDWS